MVRSMNHCVWTCRQRRSAMIIPSTSGGSLGKLNSYARCRKLTYAKFPYAHARSRPMFRSLEEGGHADEFAESATHSVWPGHARVGTRMRFEATCEVAVVERGWCGPSCTLRRPAPAALLVACHIMFVPSTLRTKRVVAAGDVKYESVGARGALIPVLYHHAIRTRRIWPVHCW
jgi:hypothetical protein